MTAEHRRRQMLADFEFRTTERGQAMERRLARARELADLDWRVTNER